MHSKAVIYNIVETEKGTFATVHLPGYTVKENIKQDVMIGEVRFDDGRRISSDQRKKVYALIKDIANHTGYLGSGEVEMLKEELKLEFIVDERSEYFSLSNVDMTTAKYFIEWLLEFCFKWEIPLALSTSSLAKEIGNWLYLCLAHRKCAICGQNHAHIHHAENLIGMGGDRKQHDHTKSKLIALCAVHHQETHTIGWESFKKKYHVDAIYLNKATIEKLKL